MDIKQKATYPDGCNDTTKKFVDKVNEAMIKVGAHGILDEFYLGQNGVYSTIFKIILPNYNITTIECFDNEGTSLYNEKSHRETVKVVKYNKNLKPIKQIKLPFNGYKSLEIAIEHVNEVK